MSHRSRDVFNFNLFSKTFCYLMFPPPPPPPKKKGIKVLKYALMSVIIQSYVAFAVRDAYVQILYTLIHYLSETNVGITLFGSIFCRLVNTSICMLALVFPLANFSRKRLLRFVILICIYFVIIVSHYDIGTSFLSEVVVILKKALYIAMQRS
jgi:hypothetical protein